jgi:hypothetical protein
MDDAFSAALGMTFSGNGKNGQSYFPAAGLASDRSDLNDMLGQSPETSFLGNGKSQAPSPTPTPTPSAVKPNQMTLADLYQHFGVGNSVAGNPGAQPIQKPMTQQPQVQPGYDWQSQYGWGSGLT